MSRSSAPFSMPWCHIQLNSTALRSLAPAAGVYGAPPRPPTLCAARTLRTAPTLRAGRSLLRTGCRCHADREDKGERGRCPTIPSTRLHGGPPSCGVSMPVRQDEVKAQYRALDLYGSQPESTFLLEITADIPLDQILRFPSRQFGVLLQGRNDDRGLEAENEVLERVVLEQIQDPIVVYSVSGRGTSRTAIPHSGGSAQRESCSSARLLAVRAGSTWDC